MGPAAAWVARATGEWDGQRIALFVDSQNLFYAARDLKGRNLDYGELLEAACRGRLLRFATAYVVEREGDPAAYGFVTKLNSLGFRVKRRTVRVHRVDDTGRTLLEGDWDMGIAADMVRASDQAEVLVLASGDGDFVPILQLVQERGRRVEVMSFRETTSQELLDLADRFVDLGASEDIFLPGARE